MLLEILLVIVIIILLFIIFYQVKKEKTSPTEIENIVNKVWKYSGIDEKIGELNLQTKEIRDLHYAFEKMLATPTQRGYFGEITLETILKDQLPQDMYGIREQISSGKKPDAFIKSTSGIICIDSKFPLENYIKMVEAKEEEKESYKKQFLQDLKKHLDKIKDDYIAPEKGTANFAFAYIPSENIWYFLVNEAFELLRNYAIEGVQVVSPLTLTSKIEFIRAGVHSKKLSEEAEKVKESLLNLSKIFDDLDESWRKFTEKHLKGLLSNADDLDKKHKKIREEFEKIKKF